MRLGERSGLLPSDRSRRSASAKRARPSPRSPAAQAPGSLTRRPLACGLGGLDSELSVSTRRPCGKTRWLRQVPPPPPPDQKLGARSRRALPVSVTKLSPGHGTAPPSTPYWLKGTSRSIQEKVPRNDNKEDTFLFTYSVY